LVLKTSVLFVLLGLALLGAACSSFHLGSAPSEEAIQTFKQYVQAVYPRDYAAAYPLISQADKDVKPEADYLRENESLSGFSLEVGRRLASLIQYKDLNVQLQGDKATINVTLVTPDSEDPALNDILFAESATSTPLTDAQKQALRDKLEDLIRQQKLPTAESEQQFNLVKESGQWRIFLGWVNGIVVRLKADVAEGLPWTFEAAQPVIRALPGKTYRAIYRAKNLTDREITAKASHSIEPKDQAKYLNTLECFCLIQQTLRPGEEQEFVLVFTIDPDIPPDVHELDVSYVFYPIEKFPANANGD
jgi:cytochrome c oxidase assembly protein CtaG/Cox11